MSKEDNIKVILERSAIGIPKVYAIGCFAKRVTFHSQQNRALNLVWALFEKGVIDSSSNISIIGAGLAGITAAIAAKQKGCNVTVYEESNLVMLMQNGNTTRYVHPNIYDWPKDGWSKSYTELPFLNWNAGITKDVRDSIIRQWDAARSGITFVKNQRINRIEITDNELYVSSSTHSLLEKTDCVLIGCGFGPERELNSIDFRSYWSDDSLHQSEVKDASKELSYLITGCGDGGLIDAQRLLIEEFDHGKFIDEFTTLPMVKALEPAINAIEADVQSLIDKKPATDIDVYIYNEYKKIPIPDELIQFFKNRIRQNTRVTLNSGSKIWSSYKATPLNRFLVFILSKCRCIHYAAGTINEAKKNGNQFLVTFNNSGSVYQLTFDRVIVRHGPKGGVVNILPYGTTLPPESTSDPTNLQLWDTGFYPTPKNHQTLTPDIMELIKYFINKNFHRDGVLFIGPRKNGDDLYVAVVLEKDNASIAASDFPPHLAGIPVIVSFENQPALPQYFYGSTFLSEYSETLKIGGPVATLLHSDEGPDNLAWGSIGCFIKTSGGRIGILSTNHTIGRDNLATDSDKLVTRRNNDSPLNYIGRPLRFLKLDFDNRIEPRNIDGAIGVLKMGQQINTALELQSDTLKINRIDEVDFYETVYKVGAGSGFTSGQVTSMYASLKMQYNNRTIYFDNVIEIKHTEGAFSKAGDSGALVFRADGAAVGIIFAGTGDYSFAYPIGPALEQLECFLFTE